jgi:hypothetical protein
MLFDDQRIGVLFDIVGLPAVPTAAGHLVSCLVYAHYGRAVCSSPGRNMAHLAQRILANCH